MENGGIHLGPSPELESYRHKYWPRFLFRWKQLAFPGIQSNVRASRLLAQSSVSALLA